MNENLTPKQQILLDENPSIQYLIEKFECSIPHNEKMQLSNKISARVDYLISPYYNKDLIKNLTIKPISK